MPHLWYLCFMYGDLFVDRILTLKRAWPWPVFRISPPSPVEGGGGVGTTPPGDRPLMGRRASRKKKQSMRLDEISRLHVYFLILGQHLTWLSQVKGQIFAKINIFRNYTLIAAKVCVVAIWNLHQRAPRSILNKIECSYCIPLQYLAYVVLLSRTASPQLAVTAVTVKIQVDRMTMIGLGDEKEVVGRRFWEQWTTNSDSAPQETPLNICRLAICHCEVNRGQWPQMTLDDLETHVVQSQGSQLVMYWHQSHQLSPFKSIAPRQVAFTHDFAEILSKVVPFVTS